MRKKSDNNLLYIAGAILSAAIILIAWFAKKR